MKKVIKATKVLNRLKMKLKYNHFNLSLGEIYILVKKIRDLTILVNHTNIKYIRVQNENINN